MKKIVLTALFGGAVISGMWTYYKTDDPKAATDVFMEKAGNACQDAWVAVKHFFTEILK